MSDTGLVALQPAIRRRIIALYAVLAIGALAMLAVIAQPRGSSPHLNEQEARRPAAVDAATLAPGR